jgi:hypothetical protein
MNARFAIMGILAACVVFLAVSVASADEPVSFVTDKAAVANCTYVGRADNSTIGFNFVVGKSNTDMQRMAAVRLGADTVLSRGKFDSMGKAYRCAK